VGLVSDVKSTQHRPSSGSETRDRGTAVNALDLAVGDTSELVAGVGAEVEGRWTDISFWVGGSFGSL
jgi:hypothetical protein